MSGETLTRRVRSFAVTYKEHSLLIDLPGCYPANEGEGVHVGDDMRAVDAALREIAPPA